MKTKVTIFLIIFLSSAALGFTPKNEIGNRFISFTSPSSLTASTPGRLPANSEKVRTVMTEKREVQISRVDGYLIMYVNNKKASFVNLKVELSDENCYAKDKENILESLRYLTNRTPEMETKQIIELEFNGYKIYGVSRSTIMSGNVLGSFVMFPGNGVSVFFDFLNAKPEFRNFANVEEYKKQRDKFMDEYTKFLKTIKDK